MLEIDSEHRLVLSSSPYEVNSNIQLFAAVVSKSFSLEPIVGDCKFEKVDDESYINRWGLDNLGANYFASNILPNIERHQKNIIASIFLKEEEDLLGIAELLPFSRVIGIELNISCPNKEGFDSVLSAVNYSKNIFPENTKIGVKVGPFIPTDVLRDLKVDFVSYSNTLPGFVEGFGTGGLSGKVLKDIVVGRISEIKEAVGGSTLIVGGGVSSYADYRQFLDYGADYVSIASSYLENNNVVFDILAGI
ncbi:hypothetical protein EBS02_10375 [bacterium]|nr:hypothetical protein [bacterium]